MAAYCRTASRSVGAGWNTAFLDGRISRGLQIVAGGKKSGSENGEVMVHLTIEVEEGLLQEAQKRAAQQGTSVDALLRSYLESYVDQDQRERQQQGVTSLLGL